MTLLHNRPEGFAEEAVDGFALAWADRIVRVHGGVVRAAASPAGEVAVVLGGGSGHYPAFAGWVGEGLAHGATCGNVFSSPSASQVYSVVRAAHNGGGALLGFGNYAGDVLHFGQAAERLRADGIDVRIIAVTDDVASAPAERIAERRGIAGDLAVFKVAGAAAAAGADLDEVERLARRANEHTRTLGLAFSGCTLPGGQAPLFTVQQGRMAIGLGIHGEPGTAEAELVSASGVADLLVDGLLPELPAVGGRLAVLLNGLGGTKYEELFVVYGRVADRLGAAGFEIVAPLVGEHVTSLDMAGLSLTVMLLDAELEPLWLAPADTPALCRAPAPEGPRRWIPPYPPAPHKTRAGSPPSQRAAKTLVEVLRDVAEEVRRHEHELGDLDAIAGDGDHGQGMVLGLDGALRAARESVSHGAGVRETLIAAGTGWSDRAGGTSGALWGAAITAAATALSDDAALAPRQVVEAVRRAGDAVTRLGGACPGDKTLVDALAPFVATIEHRFAAGANALDAWDAAVVAAHEGAASTAALSARRGRARTHGTRSLGHPDPGAVSFALVVGAASASISRQTEETA